MACYEAEKSKNPEYLSFDDATIKTFARRIVGQIKEQMKLDNEQCELLLNAIFKKKLKERKMEGNIYYIADKNTYGFINGHDGEEYFFHKSDLLNCTIYNLYEGDFVEFDYIKNDHGLKAIKIRKINGVQTDKNGNANPGINPLINLEHFTERERQIISKLSKVFYITNGGSIIQIGQSTYKYCLAKPTSEFTEQFNLQREIAVVFSDYSNFEPRTLDAIAQVILEKQRSKLRIERICSILISSDPQIELSIRDLLKNDLDMQVIIPFSYQEFNTDNWNPYNIVNRFRGYFFDRDLFAFSAPIQKDLYFFGRRDYVQSLVNRALSGEHSGVFGLRRSGKTSVLFAISRALKRNNIDCIFFDCQKIHQLRWFELLFEVVQQLYIYFQKETEHIQKEYTEKQAISLFHQDLNKLLNSRNPVILLFDEIEHLTFDIAMSSHWKTENDFIFFCQAIRSYYQTYPNKISLIIAGTNPKINETPIVNGYDNPMYEQLTNDTYLPSFDLTHTTEMVNKLGGYMGLKFNDEVCALLTTDFGGHPFLIRRVCSSINKYITEHCIQKPCKIDKGIYNVVKDLFVKNEADSFCELILFVLMHSYPNEFIALKRLAFNANDTSIDNAIISHLIGYNIITQSHQVFDFKIEIVRTYLQNKFKFSRENLTQEEKRTEISIRRNRCEQALRKLIKIQLLGKHDRNAARLAVINNLEESSKAPASMLSYENLFNPDRNIIYFKDLTNIIRNNWDCFKNFFDCKKQIVVSHLTIINDLRVDCHAKDIDDKNFASFRSSIEWLEELLKDYMF